MSLFDKNEVDKSYVERVRTEVGFITLPTAVDEKNKRKTGPGQTKKSDWIAQSPDWRIQQCKTVAKVEKLVYVLRIVEYSQLWKQKPWKKQNSLNMQSSPQYTPELRNRDTFVSGIETLLPVDEWLQTAAEDRSHGLIHKSQCFKIMWDTSRRRWADISQTRWRATVLSERIQFQWFVFYDLKQAGNWLQIYKRRCSMALLKT